MSFLHPAFLWGLFALSIPIIVHFFYLRRSRRYEFSQVRLVELLQRASKPYLRLRHLLLLFFRLALVTAVVFLFSRPYLGKAFSSTTESASVLIVWDVSPSMTPVFEVSRALVEQAIRQDPPSYEYRLLLTDGYLPRGEFVTRKVMQEKLREVQPADMGYPISALLQRSDLLFRGSRSSIRKIYIVSDFQASSVGDISRIPREGIESVVLFPVEGRSRVNAYIDSIAVTLIGGQRHLRYHLSATDNRVYTVQVEGTTRALTAGWYDMFFDRQIPPYVKFSIAGDEVTFDNEAYVGLLPAEETNSRIGWLGPKEAESAFEKLHQVLGVSPWKGSSKGEIPWQRLSVLVASMEDLPAQVPTWVAEGGLLITFPPPNCTSPLWRKLPFAAEIELVQKHENKNLSSVIKPKVDAFWEGIFMHTDAQPTFLAEPLRLRQFYSFQVLRGFSLLEDVEGHPLLWEVSWGKGKIYLFSFPWGEAGLGEHSVFVPLFERLYQRSGPGVERGRVVWLGQKTAFSFPVDEGGRVVLRHVGTGQEYLPPIERRGNVQRFFLGEHPMKAGLYEIAGAKNLQGYLGVNISPEESAGEYLSVETWEKMGFPAEVRRWDGRDFRRERVGFLWRDWWIWLGIAFLLIIGETFWARSLLRPVIEPVP
ncbi:MAG: BatA domain-containing protein [Bacteroidia bacterium]|nr:BatA domain-containing protein [Bacteroidia bacterium]